MIEQTFTLLLTTLYTEPTLFIELYKINDLSDVFLRILMNSNNENLRHIVAYTIMTICDIVVDNDQFKLISGDEG